MAFSFSPVFVAFNLDPNFGVHFLPCPLFVDPGSWLFPVVSAFLRTEFPPPLCVLSALLFPPSREARRLLEVCRKNWKPARPLDSVAEVSLPRGFVTENAA